MAKPKAMDLKNCTVILRDGTATPNELTLKIDEGNLNWTSRFNKEARKDRGNLDYIHEGDQEAMQVSIECRFDEITSSSGEAVSPHEFLTKTGAASAYESTADDCAAYSVDIVVEVDQTCGTVEDEIITFPDFSVEEIGGSFGDGTLSISGICNAILPTGVRTTLA